MAEEFYYFDAEQIRRLRELLDFVNGMLKSGGAGQTVTPFGVSQRASRRNPSRSVPTPQSVSPLVLVKVTGDASGGGKYNGRILTTPAAAAAATGTLAESDVGTIPGADNALVLNTQEVGRNTHDLDSAGALPLIFLGMTIGTTTDGKTIVVIDGDQWEDCE